MDFLSHRLIFFQDPVIQGSLHESVLGFDIRDVPFKDLRRRSHMDPGPVFKMLTIHEHAHKEIANDTDEQNGAYTPDPSWDSFPGSLQSLTDLEDLGDQEENGTQENEQPYAEPYPMIKRQDEQILVHQREKRDDEKKQHPAVLDRRWRIRIRVMPQV